MENTPLVSVIIPMYNAAQFIPQTLESLLYQTMKNFEVIIVDDCSTDNSVEVVEQAALPLIQEGIKIRLIELPENVGMPGVVRNVGMDFAHGKYIAFLDSDDMYTKTALEELSTLAEEYQVDVVHTDTFFLLFEKNPKSDEEYLSFKNLNELLSPDNLTVCKRQTLPFLSKPTLETADLTQRLNYWLNYGYHWESVTMFCKRNFLIEKQITFSRLRNDEDKLFSFWLLCSTEKFLRVPNIIYIYRQRLESTSKKKLSNSEQNFKKWFHVLCDGINEFEKIMASVNVFDNRPDYRYAVLNVFYNQILPAIFPPHTKTPVFAFNDFFKREFSSDEASFAAYLFNTVNIQRLQIAHLQQELEKFYQQ